MILTKENASEIAQKMSNELNGPVLSITADFKINYRIDKNGLDTTGWLANAAKQKLPVKVLDMQILWSTGHYSYSASFDDTTIEFPSHGIVTILQRSGSGEREFSGLL